MGKRGGAELIVLVTRPHAEGQHTCQALALMGHEGLLAPLMEIECLVPVWPQGHFDALVVTSAEALRCLDAHSLPQALRHLPLYGVGARLGSLVQDKGLGEIVELAPRVSELITRLTARGVAGQRLLYLAGRYRKPDFERDLARAGAFVSAVELYAARDVGGLSVAASQALEQGQIGAVLHFSRRSAELFVTHVRAAGLEAHVAPIWHCAISPDAAEPLHAVTSLIKIAERPDAASLLALMQNSNLASQRL
ncbi:MAG: uroporphyrinogen-III synthase [Alphaproteobacteria bacterium]|nr:uroporphyrinogen-III synthase [Alphaproteobacteria bacterium]